MMNIHYSRWAGLCCAGLAWVIACSSAMAQDAPDQTNKQIRALRITQNVLRVDGVLDDSVWARAQFVNDFRQKDPVEGGQPTERVEVGILYDNEAIYVGARMFCADPEKLRMYLDRRDTQGPAEQIIIAFDSFRDRRTAYAFGVNTAGVRFERYHPEDAEYRRDYSFNPVWEAKTAVGTNNWTAEMRIPFSQLRFNNREVQEWGVNFNHWIPERNEDVYWVYTPRNELGYASRFGKLVGISGIKPSRRVELMPYGASDLSWQQVDPDHPFAENRELAARVGGDLKMGLGPNLTLDATFNPDFGQVEADPAEVNLSAYETFFSEKRPFFTEGSQLFDINGPQYFYSRRIGQAPRGSLGDGLPADFTDRPANTTILGAAKVTGRLPSGTSIGGLVALTEREYGRAYNQQYDKTSRRQIEPATVFGVFRGQQEFGRETSTAGLMFTGVYRDLNDDRRLADQFHRRAFSGGADWNLRFNNGMYQVDGYAGFSNVQGTPQAILNTQQSSAHYYQRPDQDHVSIDTAATSMTGFTSSLSLSKQSGRHWLGGVGYSAESPGFELNNAGILSSADDIGSWAYLTYRETEPGPTLRSYSAEINLNSGWNYGGVRQYASTEFFLRGTWNNYLQTWLAFDIEWGGRSDALTRGGPLMKSLLDKHVFGGWSTNHAAPTRYGMEMGYAWDDLQGWFYWVEPEFSTRVGQRGQISLEPRYSRDEQPRQYVATIADAGGGDHTYGKRYIFSRIQRSNLSLELRLNYFFTPDLSLEVYAEPFVASGRYFKYGELASAGDHELRFYGEADGTTIVHHQDGSHRVTDGEDEFVIPSGDYGWRSMRSNLVLRWEFHPGSTLYFVWQRNLGEDKHPGRNVRPGELFDTFGITGDDFVALKISYWLPLSSLSIIRPNLW